jgi:hypothetical protein
MNKNLRVFLILTAVALVIAVLRYYMKGLLQPMVVSDFAGSFVASITIFTLIVGMILGVPVYFVAKQSRPANAPASQ